MLCKSYVLIINFLCLQLLQILLHLHNPIQKEHCSSCHLQNIPVQKELRFFCIYCPNQKNFAPHVHIFQIRRSFASSVYSFQFRRSFAPPVYIFQIRRSYAYSVYRSQIRRSYAPPVYIFQIRRSCASSVYIYYVSIL